jgi:ankyrin repeat protein
LGADINTPNNIGATPFYIAAEKGHVEALRVLKDLGANINTPTHDSATPFFTTAQNGHFNAVQELIGYGANPKECFISTQQSLIAFAAPLGDEIIIKMNKKIVQQIALGNDVNHIELLPKDIAEIMGYSEIVDALNNTYKTTLKRSLSSSNSFFKKGQEGEAVDDNRCTTITMGGSYCLMKNSNYLPIVAALTIVLSWKSTINFRITFYP